MHSNEALVQRFFHCFAGGDYRGMQQCLHPDIEFSDVGFDLKRKEVGAMRHMICAKGTQIMFRNIQADDSTGSAHWECHYDFQ
jgi:ketosteroid isomerase-like protein